MDLAFDAERRAKLVPVYVAVVETPSTPEDTGVAGVYLVNVEPHLAEESRAEAALDQFHDHCAIDCLDDFEIVVYNADGAILPRIENYNSGSLLQFAEFIDLLDEKDIPPAVRARRDGEFNAPDDAL